VRLLLRRRAEPTEYSYAQSAQLYGLNSAPQSATSTPASPRAAAEQNPPLATDKPSEEPAESLSAPIGAIAPPPAGAAAADGTPAQAGDDYMPAEEKPAAAEDQSAAAAPQASEQSSTDGADSARPEPPAEPADDAAAPPDEPAAPDDLLVIEGIGPKISTIIVAAGITSFAELAAADADNLKSILHDAGIHTANPSTWPQQARLAADRQWDELRDLQERIVNGRIEE
jgi:predicted flap endonuclease-1-like 5' DNA nuclease